MCARDHAPNRDLRELPSVHELLLRLPPTLRDAFLRRQEIRRVLDTYPGYSNLEYDLASGKRGKRDVHAGMLLERLLGKPAIAVNNNAVIQIDCCVRARAASIRICRKIWTEAAKKWARSRQPARLASMR